MTNSHNTHFVINIIRPDVLQRSKEMSCTYICSTSGKCAARYKVRARPTAHRATVGLASWVELISGRAGPPSDRSSSFGMMRRSFSRVGMATVTHACVLFAYIIKTKIEESRWWKFHSWTVGLAHPPGFNLEIWSIRLGSDKYKLLRQFDSARIRIVLPYISWLKLYCLIKELHSRKESTSLDFNLHIQFRY